MKRYRYIVFAGLIFALSVFSSPRAAYATDVNETVAQAALSADNSLSQLSISGASLSPDFYYSTVRYSATVAYEVTDVTVSAKTSNDKATIVSITGNENLNVGENSIEILVRAENGNEATYRITLTRLKEEAADSGTAGEETAGEETSVEVTAAEENTSDSGTSVDEPEDAQAQETEPVEPVQISYGDYGLTVVNPPEGEIPDALVQVSLDVDGTVILDAYQYESEMMGADLDVSTCYFLYGTDSLDATGWFVYDSSVGMFVRFPGQIYGSEADGEDTGETVEAEPVQESGMVDSDAYAQLLADYNTAVTVQKQLQQKVSLMTAVFLFIVVILLVIMFSILWSKRKDEIDSEELFEDEKQPIKKEKPLTVIPTASGVPVQEKETAKETVERTTDAKETANLTSDDKVTEEPEAEKPQESPKKKKRRDSILAYLGLDDDLPLDYGDELDDEEEPEEDVEAEPKSHESSTSPKKKSSADAGKNPARKESAPDAEAQDDIEFIDL